MKVVYFLLILCLSFFQSLSQHIGSWPLNEKVDTLQCRLMICKENDFVPYVINGYVVITSGIYLDWQKRPDNLYLDEDKVVISNQHVWNYKKYNWKLQNKITFGGYDTVYIPLKKKK